MSSTSPTLAPSITCPILSCHFKSNSCLRAFDNFWAILWEKNWGPWTLLHVGLDLIRVLSLAVMLIGDSGQGIISNWIKILSFSCFQKDTVCVSFSLQIWLSAGCIEFGQKSSHPPFSQTSPEFQCSKKFCYNTKLVPLNLDIDECIHVISWIKWTKKILYMAFVLFVCLW